MEDQNQKLNLVSAICALVPIVNYPNQDSTLANVTIEKLKQLIAKLD